MRLFKRSKEREPTDQMVLLRHRTDSYGEVRVYNFNGSLTASGDIVIVAGHQLTPAELKRGWYAP